MIGNAGSRRWRMPLAPGLAFILGLGLAVASQPALAGVEEPGVSQRGSAATPLSGTLSSDEALRARTGTQADTPIVVAEKYKNNWNKNKNWNKNWNKNYSNKNIYVNKHRGYVRNWKHRPYYGQFFGGIVLGSILTAAIAGVPPPPPRPDLCWYWSDPYRSRGYWDYCYYPGY